MKIVIVGGGVAGITAASTIRENDSKVKIEVYTDEKHPYYPRPRLYEILSGEVEPQDTYLFSEQWYKKRDIKVHLKKKAVSIDTTNKTVLFEDHIQVTYDKLLLTNGAHPFVPPIKGREKIGVFTLRSMKDALTIKKYAKNSKTSIIIGGGLLGLEFGASLRKLGQQVTVVEISPRLLPRQLDQDGAVMLEDRIESRGIHVEVGVKTLEIVGEKKASGILLENGKEIEGNLILISAGVRSNTKLGKEAGMNVNKGILVNRYLQTSVNDVYAAGDVAEVDGMVSGIIPAALEQAKIAAINILKGKTQIYQGTVPSNTLKIIGIDLTSMGLVNPDEPRYEEIREIDKENGIYKKIVLEHGKIVGAIILGERQGVTFIKKLMDQKIDITKDKDSLLKKRR